MHLTFLYLLLHIVSAHPPTHQDPFIPSIMSLRHSLPVTQCYNVQAYFRHETDTLDAFNARLIQKLMVKILTAVQDGVTDQFNKIVEFIMATSSQLQLENSPMSSLERALIKANLGSLLSQEPIKGVLYLIQSSSEGLPPSFQDIAVVISSCQNIRFEPSAVLDMQDLLFENNATKFDLSMFDPSLIEAFSGFLKSYFVNLHHSQHIPMMISFMKLPLEAEPIDIFVGILHNTGPMMHKFVGQLFGDTAPPSVRDKLSAFKQNIQPMNIHDYRKAIERFELAHPDICDDLEIEITAIAAASVGQGHKVKYRREPRFLKLLRYGIVELFEHEFNIMESNLHNLKSTINIEGLVTMMAEMKASIVLELDLRNEANNMNQMRPLYQKGNITVPEVYFSSKEVLIMDLVDGVTVANFLHPSKLDEDTEDSLEEYQHRNSPHHTLHLRNLSLNLRQFFGLWFQHAMIADLSIFHADPHSGNQMTHNEILTILDFGSIGSLPVKSRKALIRMSIGVLLNSPKVVLTGVREFNTDFDEKAVLECIRKTFVEEPLRAWSIIDISRRLTRILQVIASHVSIENFDGISVYGRAQYLLLSTFADFRSLHQQELIRLGVRLPNPIAMMIQSAIKHLNMSCISLGLAAIGAGACSIQDRLDAVWGRIF